MTDTLAMNILFDIDGAYPSQSGGTAACTMAMAHNLAGTIPAYGAPPCDGRLLPVIDHQALNSLIGGIYSGSGITEVALPDLRGRTPLGGGPIQPSVGQSLAMTYMIAAEAPAGAAFPMIGAIGLFGGDFAPSGWLAADGSDLTIPQNIALFQAIGTAFGGNPDIFFRLPDLGQRAAVGAGGGVALGEDVPAGDNGVPGLGINYLINVGGQPAPEGGTGGFPATGEALGEVIACAAAGIPPGWAPCDGSLFTIADNRALFGLIGTTYGGDGKTTFALPDLRGKMLTGPARTLTIEANESGGGTGWQTH